MDKNKLILVTPDCVTNLTEGVFGGVLHGKKLVFLRWI